MSLFDPLVALGALASTAILLLYMKNSGKSANIALAKELIAKGLLSEQQNEFGQARIELERALKELDSSPEGYLSEQATCLVHLGNIYEKVGDPEQARLAYKRVLDQWQSQIKTSKINLSDIDYLVTNVDFGRGTYAVAEFYVDNVITLRESSLPLGHPDIETSHKIGAKLLRKAGYVQEAELLEQRTQQNTNESL